MGDRSDAARVIRRWGEIDLCAVPGGLELWATGARPDSFDRVVAAHGVRHPRLPRVHDQGTVLRFDIEAAFDLEALVAEVERLGSPRLPYQAALALGDDLADAVEALHAGGCFLGALSWAAVVVTLEGEWSLIAGAVPGGSLVHAAPEVLTGTRPNATTDVYAVMSLLERMRHVAVIPEAQLRVLTGEVRPEEAAYAAAFADTHLRGLSVAPGMRIPTLGEARAAHHRLWDYTGHRPDRKALRDYLREVVALASRRRVLRVGPDCGWLVLPSSERVDLSRARSLRHIVAHLVVRHADADHVCTLPELAAAGWPGERIAKDAARNRTHVALTKLRQRGLRSIIETSDAGWRLARDLVIEQVAAAP